MDEPEFSGAHDCACCSDIIYSAEVICDDCRRAECEPNRSGAYDDCRRTDCGCGAPGIADFYVSTIWGRDVPGGTETSYADGYYCLEHMPAGADMIPADAYVIEYEATDIDRMRRSPISL